jgi:hypothetical protein
MARKERSRRVSGSFAESEDGACPFNTCLGRSRLGRWRSFVDREFSYPGKRV